MSFSKGDRIAILSILLCIIGLVIAAMFSKSRVSFDEASLHNLDSLLALRQAAVEEWQQQKLLPSGEVSELQPFPFNPNTMTEEEGQRMGLTDRQIRNIINYREKGGKFYSKKDLAKLYTINEEDFAQLEPFIILPEVMRKESTKAKSERKENQEVKKDNLKLDKRSIPIVDLNTVDSATLVELPQIGSYTASRIIAFREKLGGFIDKEQLLDVKGMDAERFNAILPYISIGAEPVGKIDVNRADFKALVSHPYLNYNQVKRIVNQREKRGMIKDWAQLEALLKDEEPTHPYLKHYVKFGSL